MISFLISLVKVLSFSFTSLPPSLPLAFLSFGFNLLYRTILIIIEVIQTSRILFSHQAKTKYSIVKNHFLTYALFSSMDHTSSHIKTIYRLLSLLTTTFPRFKFLHNCRLSSVKQFIVTKSRLHITNSHQYPIYHTIPLFQVHHRFRIKKHIARRLITACG